MRHDFQSGRTTVILTKPCARADRWCDRLVEASHACELRARRYCSVSCAVKARVEAGWQPHAVLTRESQARGGQRGGKLAGLHRRKANAQRIAKALEPHLTPLRTAGLTPEQMARLKVLLVRAYRIGYRTGYRGGYGTKTYRAKARLVYARKELA